MTDQTVPTVPTPTVSEPAKPTCSICYNDIVLEKFNAELRCSNPHSEMVCNDCFFETDKCPICRQPIVQSSSMAREKRRAGLRKLKDRVKMISEQSMKMLAELQSKELRSLYESKMAATVVELRNAFSEVLRVQAVTIIGNHFMRQTDDDKTDLLEIDDFMLQISGADKYKHTDFGKIMSWVVGVEQKRALEALMQQPNVVFTMRV